ncbi:unnamed protein product [Adineta ricciae]|uniref:Uncharacterized protein n=1 Tax=Adineta ricciae TaxID=249248 RepID=A0A814NA15_ADIRI|nr:unnamed protein product [Adineta ricciae]
MNNNGNFNNNQPAALMSYPFPMQNPPRHPTYVEPSYTNQPSQHYPTHMPHYYHPRAPMPAPPKPEKRKQEILTCDTCGIEVNSQQMMEAHIRGQKHIKKMKLKTVSGTNTPTNETVANTNAEKQNPMSTSPTVATPADAASQNEPNLSVTTPIVKPTPSSDKSALQLMNELAKHNKVDIKYDLVKESGPAHCKQFEVQLTVGSEIYHGQGTSIKRAQHDAAEQALVVTALRKPDSNQRGSYANRPNRGGNAPQGMYSNVRYQYPSQPPIPLPPQQQQQQLPMRQKTYMPTEQQAHGNNQQSLLNFIESKCAEISENEHTISTLQRLVEDIERALKTVSDKITEQSKRNNTPVIPKLPDNVKLNNVEQNYEDSAESFRMLKGAMKVSILAMRLFLQTDYEYALVLICANKPTKSLLNEICEELTIGLNAQAIAALQLDSSDEQSKPITYKIEAHVDDACLTVQCSILPKHTIRVLLTSPVFRSENFLNLDDDTRQQISALNPDPIDMLDKGKCLQAAAEIRHSNWFTHCMLENNSNSTVLRILRSLQQNQTPLSHLSLWSLALLVHKCQNQPATSSASLFRSVFTCISSGVLLPNQAGLGIIDPCEKEPTDAAASLTMDQRLNITSYAQHVLRLIAFEKYEKIFQSEASYQAELSTSQNDKIDQ